MKEKLQKDIADNRESIARNEKMRQTEEEEEEMVTVIMAETKKMLAKARRLKELEVCRPNILILCFAPRSIQGQTEKQNRSWTSCSNLIQLNSKSQV